MLLGVKARALVRKKQLRRRGGSSGFLATVVDIPIDARKKSPRPVALSWVQRCWKRRLHDNESAGCIIISRGKVFQARRSFIWRTLALLGFVNRRRGNTRSTPLEVIARFMNNLLLWVRSTILLGRSPNAAGGDIELQEEGPALNIEYQTAARDESAEGAEASAPPRLWRVHAGLGI